MANLLEQAIECNDGEHAAKIIQHEASTQVSFPNASYRREALGKT